MCASRRGKYILANLASRYPNLVIHRNPSGIQTLCNQKQVPSPVRQLFSIQLSTFGSRNKYIHGSGVERVALHSEWRCPFELVVLNKVVKAAVNMQEERVDPPKEVARVVGEAVFERWNTDGLLEYCAQDPFDKIQESSAEYVGKSGKPNELSAERKYYVYDVAFTSVTAIGLNLAVKGRTVCVEGQAFTDTEVLVESFASGYFPVKKLGTVRAKDVIVSASVSGKFLRRVKDTKTLIAFLRTNGRPVCIRFRRNPSFVGIDELLAVEPNKARELFLDFLKQERSAVENSPVRKLSPRKSSNVKEALRKTRSRLLNLGRNATQSDTEEEESSEEESLSPEKGSPGANEYASFDDLKNWKHHVYLFAIEVEKLKKAFLQTTEMDSASSGCPALTHSIYSRFLVHSSAECILGTLAREEYRLISQPSDKVFTALKAFEQQLLAETQSSEKCETATAEETGCKDPGSESPAKSVTPSDATSHTPSLALAEADYEAFLVEVLVPFQAIALSLLKTEVFPPFVQSAVAQGLVNDVTENRSVQTKSANPVIFSRYLPQAIWHTYRKAANSLLIYLVSAHPKDARRRLSLEYWIIMQFEPQHREIGKTVTAAQELLGIPGGGNQNANLLEVKTGLEHVIFGPGLSGFLLTPLGACLLEAYDRVCYEGKPDGFGAEIPRLSQVVNLCGGEERLVLHRTWASTVHSTVRSDDKLEFDSSVAVFIVRDATSFDNESFIKVLGVQNYNKTGEIAEGVQTQIPVHAEKFFVPGGSESRDKWRPFAFNFSIQNPAGTEIQGACAVTYTPDKTSSASTRVGMCLLSESPESTESDKLRYVLSKFADSVVGFREFQWDPRKTLDVDLKHVGEIMKAGMKPEMAPFSVERMEMLDLQLIHECLSAENMLRVFEMCLLEQKVLFVSTHYGVLQRVMRGFKKLLEPLSWCHIFIPVLPRCMLDHLQCPTPFLIGINKQFAFKHDFPYSVLDVVIVDLDEDSVQLPDTTPVCFPIAQRSLCVRGLKDALSSRFSVGDLISVYSGGETNVVGELAVSAIRKLFQNLVDLLVSNCDRFALRVTHAAEEVVLFREADYIEHQRSHQLHWNDVFLRTQAFSKYLASNVS